MSFFRKNAELHQLAEELAEKARTKREDAAAVLAEAEEHAAESERARRIADWVHALTQ